MSLKITDTTRVWLHYDTQRVPAPFTEKYEDEHVPELREI